MNVTYVQFFSLGLNIVYTKVGGDSSAGPLPTVKLSRRERYSQMTQYAAWELDQIYTGSLQLSIFAIIYIVVPYNRQL